MQQFRCCRRGNGHNSVSRLDEPATYPQRGTINPVDAQIIKSKHRADNINDGIHCADFMKMDFFNRHPMNLGFCCPQTLKNQTGFFLHRLRQLSFPDEFENIRQTPVMMTGRQVNIDMRRLDAAFVDRFHL